MRWISACWMCSRLCSTQKPRSSLTSLLISTLSSLIPYMQTNALHRKICWFRDFCDDAIWFAMVLVDFGWVKTSNSLNTTFALSYLCSSDWSNSPIDCQTNPHFHEVPEALPSLFHIKPHKTWNDSRHPEYSPACLRHKSPSHNISLPDPIEVKSFKPINWVHVTVQKPCFTCVPYAWRWCKLFSWEYPNA